MHATQIGYEQQYQVRSPDGTIIWLGGAIITGVYLVKNASTTVPWIAGAPIVPDSSIVVAGEYNTGTADPLVVILAGLGSTTNSSIGYLGVSITPCPATVTTGAVTRDGKGLVAGLGSIAAVNVLDATGGNGHGPTALGGTLGASTTAQVAYQIAAAAGTAGATGTVLGSTIKVTAAIGANASPTGYLGFAAGVLIGGA